MKKRILITHTDLDGAGCAILFKKYYPDIEVQYHDYKTIEEISEKLLKEKDDYEKIYFADITPVEEIGKEMLKDDKFVLIDHHKTRTYLEGTKYFDTNYCGTLLSYKYLLNEYCSDKDMIVTNFVGLIDAWDCWKLDSPYRKDGENLNLLFGYYGMEIFVRLFSDLRGISITEDTMLLVLKNIKEKYLKHKLQQCKLKEDEDGNRYWEVYIGESQSGLGNMLEMADVLPENLKYLKCIFINDNSVSLYTIDKLNFDVSIVAKKNGGGGHKNAAGYVLK